MCACIPRQELQQYIATSNNLTGTPHAAPLGPDALVNILQNARAYRTNQDALHSDMVKAVQDSLNIDNGYYQDMSAAASSQLDMKTLRDLLVDGELLNNYYVQQARDMVRGADNIRAMSWFDKMALTVRTKLVDASNLFNTWGLYHAPSEGKTAGANKISRDFDRIPAAIQGTINHISETLIKPWLDQVRPIAEHLGLDTIELAKKITQIQQARHVPELYDHILSRNERTMQSLAQTINDPNTSDKMRIALQRQYDKLMSNNEELAKYRFATYPYTTNGRRHLTVGMTETEAQQFIDDFYKTYTDLDPNTINNLADQFTQLNNGLFEWATKNGLYTKEEIANIPTQFKHFVHMFNHSDVRVSRDPDPYVFLPGNLHSAGGTRSVKIMDGLTATMKMVERFARSEATRPLAYDLMELHRQDPKGVMHGLMVADMDVAQRLAQTNTDLGRMWKDKLEGTDGFAFTLVVPKPTKADPAATKKMLIGIRNTWEDKALGITGVDLTKALVAKTTDGMLSKIGGITGGFGSLNTFYSPTFAPVNMHRDMFERIFTLPSQSYVLNNGKVVDGASFMAPMIANSFRVAKFLFDRMRGKAQGDSDLARAFNDYNILGLRQQFDPSQQRNINRSILLDDIKELEPLKNQFGSRWQQFKNLFGRWSDMWNNIAPLTQYYTLLSHGVARESARQGTLEIMNLYKGGELAPLMRAVWVFAKPTMQGGANLFRAIGLAPNAAGEFKMNAKGLFTAAGLFAAAAVLKQMTAGMMGEENFDKLSLEDKAKFIPIQFGENDLFKIALPFGITQPMFMLYHVADMISRGKIDPMDGAGHVIASVARAVSPQDYPGWSIKDDPLGFLREMLTPALLAPLASVSANKNHFGSQITYADPDSITPMSQQGAANTPTNWKKLAQGIHSLTGIDYAPEQWRALFEGYAGGILKALPDAVSFTSDYRGSFDDTTRGQLGPALSALGFSMLYKALPESHAAQFYEEFSRIKSELKSLGVNFTGNYKTKEDRISFQTNLMREHGIDEETISRYFGMQEALNEKRNKTKELRENVDRVLDSGDDAYYEQLRELYQAWAEDLDQTVYLPWIEQ